MSSIYKRKNSSKWQWAAYYKGIKLRKSTGLKKKHLAEKVRDQWDLNLALGDLSFLGFSVGPSLILKEYIFEHLKFIEKRKSDKTLVTTKGVLSNFEEFLVKKNIFRLDEINVKAVNGYLDSLKVAPKTKKNHLVVISGMLKQATIEGLIRKNPARQATLPRIITTDLHRLLEPIDIKIIFNGAGHWKPYYAFLLYTGLRAGDVALLKRKNIDLKEGAIVSLVRKSRRTHKFPLAKALLDYLPPHMEPEQPLFPRLYTHSERTLNDNLAKPRKFMQSLLEAHDRPHATLHSFRHTFNNALRDLGLRIEDRQALLGHASSAINKIYTHPNFELASDYVNKIPTYLNEASE